MQYALPVEAPQRSAGSVCRRKKPSETKFTKTDCCFFANKRYLCRRKAPKAAMGTTKAGCCDPRISGPEHKPVSARKLEWWNGRHEGLKILWPLRLCGFESRFEYREPRRTFCVALLFLQFRIFATSVYNQLAK